MLCYKMETLLSSQYGMMPFPPLTTYLNIFPNPVKILQMPRWLHDAAAYECFVSHVPLLFQLLPVFSLSARFYHLRYWVAGGGDLG